MEVIEIQGLQQRAREIESLMTTSPGMRKYITDIIRKAVRDLISISKVIAKEELRFEKDPESMSKKELEKLVKQIDKKMKQAAAELNFEAAAELRDKMMELKIQ
mgnify:CR=1 FL=1